MKMFSDVKRFQPETTYGDQPWYTSEANMDESIDGEYVKFTDYMDLLENYLEVSFILKGLEK